MKKARKKRIEISEPKQNEFIIIEEQGSGRNKAITARNVEVKILGNTRENRLTLHAEVKIAENSQVTQNDFILVSEHACLLCAASLLIDGYKFGSPKRGDPVSAAKEPHPNWRIPKFMDRNPIFFTPEAFP